MVVPSSINGSPSPIDGSIFILGKRLHASNKHMKVTISWKQYPSTNKTNTQRDMRVTMNFNQTKLVLIYYFISQKREWEISEMWVNLSVGILEGYKLSWCCNFFHHGYSSSVQSLTNRDHHPDSTALTEIELRILFEL